jgi:hypothetical protein
LRLLLQLPIGVVAAPPPLFREAIALSSKSESSSELPTVTAAGVAGLAVRRRFGCRSSARREGVRSSAFQWTKRASKQHHTPPPKFVTANICSQYQAMNIQLVAGNCHNLRDPKMPFSITKVKEKTRLLQLVVFEEKHKQKTLWHASSSRSRGHQIPDRFPYPAYCRAPHKIPSSWQLAGRRALAAKWNRSKECVVATVVPFQKEWPRRLMLTRPSEQNSRFNGDRGAQVTQGTKA